MRKLMYRTLVAGVCALGIISMLTACTTPVLYKDTLQRNCQVERQIHKARLQNSAVSPADRVQSRFYTTNVYHSGETPQWFYRPVTMRANNLPLYILMNKVLPSNVITVQYGAGADKNQLMTLNYTGTIGGALNAIAAKTTYAYDVEDNMLTWSSVVTKTFDVSFMPGSSQYLMGQKSGDSMLSLTASGSGSSPTGQSADSQFSSLEGTLSVWKDLEASIKEMLSVDGRVMVSQSTTTVTVQDHPENVQKVSDYLTSMNRDLSREVLLQVKVLEVNLDKNFDYGINWNLVYNTELVGAGVGVGSGNLINASAATPLGVGGLKGAGPLSALSFFNGSPTIGTGNSPGVGIGILHGPFQGTQLLANALAQQGSVSTVTNPDVVTLNNQVAQIDISTQTSYLASVTATNTAQVGSSVSLTPGVVSTGFKLYILPKIMGRNVYLQLSSSLTNLDSLQTLSVPTGNSTSPNSEIQLPTVSGKRFNLRSMVPSGDTLIIAGFRQDKSTANTSTMFGSTLLGGKGADRNNVETVVLISPSIVGTSR